MFRAILYMLVMIATAATFIACEPFHPLRVGRSNPTVCGPTFFITCYPIPQETKLDNTSYLLRLYWQEENEENVRERSLKLIKAHASEATIKEGFDYFVVLRESLLEWSVSSGSKYSDKRIYSNWRQVLVKMFRGYEPPGGLEVYHGVGLQNDLGPSVNELGKKLKWTNPKLDAYGPKDEDYGGYTEIQLGSDRFQVIFEGSRDELYVYYRAAQMTIERGYDYFETMPEKPDTKYPFRFRDDSRNEKFIMTTYHGGMPSLDILLSNRSRLAPHNVSILIRMYKGLKAEYNYAAFNAQEILDNVGPLISPRAD